MNEVTSLDLLKLWSKGEFACFKVKPQLRSKFLIWSLNEQRDVSSYFLIDFNFDYHTDSVS